jgi:NitT/TauT family transport system substrate-binding protein
LLVNPRHHHSWVEGLCRAGLLGPNAGPKKDGVMQAQARVGLLALVVVGLLACAGPGPAPSASGPALTATAPPPAAVPTLAAPTAPPPAGAPARKVTFASTAAVSDGGVYLAMDRGYFQQQAIALEYTVIQSGPQAIPLLASNQIEAAGGAISAGLFNAVARGIPLKLVADKNSALPGFNIGSVVVRADLADQVRRPRDLVGRRVAMAALQGSLEVQLVRYLRSEGDALGIDDVDVATMSYPDGVAALANGAVEAAVLIEPPLGAAVRAGVAVPLRRIVDYWPGNQGAVVMYAPDFAADRDAATRFMVAYLRGVRDYYNAFVKGVDRAGVIDVLTRYSSLKDTAVYEQIQVQGLHPDGEINRASVEYELNYYVEHGYVAAPVDLDRLIDPSYAEGAVRVLGPYPW